MGEGEGEEEAQTSSAVVPPTPSPSPQGGGEPRRNRGEGSGSAEAVGPLSAAARQTCESLVLDVIGLAVAARSEPYMRAALAAWD